LKIEIKNTDLRSGFLRTSSLASGEQLPRQHSNKNTKSAIDKLHRHSNIESRHNHSRRSWEKHELSSVSVLFDVFQIVVQRAAQVTSVEETLSDGHQLVRKQRK
jgi:hypothetical protein